MSYICFCMIKLGVGELKRQHNTVEDRRRAPPTDRVTFCGGGGDETHIRGCEIGLNDYDTG